MAKSLEKKQVPTIKKVVKYLFLLYVVLGIINFFIHQTSFEGIGTRWIWHFNPEWGNFMGSINPMTIIMSFAIIIGLVIFSSTVKFEVIPNTKRQTFIEILLSYFWDIVELSIPKHKYKKPVFVMAMTLFIYILSCNWIGSFPGIGYNPDNGHYSLFLDTFYAPTSDLNVNGTYALMVLIISHSFSINSKGFLPWLKGFIEPSPFLLPLNIVGELAKPVSHSMRLFGNIMGGGILVYIICQMLKYAVLPAFLWGYFGMFSGLVQAFIFTLLTIAWTGSLVE